MTPEEILSEMQKCINSPYYFATKYLTVRNRNNEIVPFTAPLSEEEFNRIFNNYSNKT